MSPGLVATAVLVVAAAVVCVCTRDGRVRVLALAAVSLLSPVIADPLPDALPLAARLTAMVLGLFALWASIRVRTASEQATRLGWPVAVLIALTAFLAGLGPLLPFGERPGPLIAQGAGLALMALAVGPIAAGRGALRMGGGLILLFDGAVVLSSGLAGTPTADGQVVGGLVFLCLAVAVALLRAAEVREGEPLDLSDPGPAELFGPPAR